MITIPLLRKAGHIFVEVQEQLWLFDTGAPTSFGDAPRITIANTSIPLQDSYLGLTASQLTTFIGVECCGLLGADCLGLFDHVIDGIQGSITISKDELTYSGQCVPIHEFMGIPIVTAFIGGNAYRVYFDTGAQISYLQDNALAEFPASGRITDFYPGFGTFETDTYDVPVSLGDVTENLRFGTLPGLLGMTLLMTNTKGILGNAFLMERTVGYFPRRKLLCV